MRNEGELPGGPLVGGAWERRRTGDGGGKTFRKDERGRGQGGQETGERRGRAWGSVRVAQRGRMRAVRGRDGAMEEQDGRIRTEGGRRGGGRIVTYQRISTKSGESEALWCMRLGGEI
jgi:hypothetical protein